jgi:hypothetical protein
MSKADLRIDWATHEAAKYACEHWHYSKSIPTPPLLYIGAWELGKFIGVVLFGRGANNNLGKPYGLDQTECCELVRIALTNHKAQVTRITAQAIGFLKRNAASMRLIISYADPMQGHHGGIYQGGNWIYTGKTSPDRYYITHDGKRVHSRMVCESGFKRVYGQKRKVLTPKECKEKHTTEGKHRYLMPLDAEMKAAILPLSKPYPRRASSETSDTASVQLEKGGATPTDALHSNGGT